MQDGARPARRGPHDDRDRPPPLDGPRRRPDRRARPRPDRRARDARGAARPAAAATPRSPRGRGTRTPTRPTRWSPERPGRRPGTRARPVRHAAKPPPAPHPDRDPRARRDRARALYTSGRASAFSGARDDVGGRGSAPALPLRPGPHPPGPEHDQLRRTNARPKVDGYITSFRPNLVRADGKVPPVDVIHLHHAVWLVDAAQPTWAAGEEKTAVRLPGGYGWRYRTSDTWILNHMIHNLTGDPDRVWVTWDMDFVPATAPAARHLHAVDTNWVDAAAARPTRSSTPSRARAPAGATRSPTRPRTRTPTARCRATSGSSTHDSTLSRPRPPAPGRPVHRLTLTPRRAHGALFRSRAHYFEPAGAVSWDVSMTPRRELARRREARATCSRSTAPTTPRGPPGTRPWRSCPWPRHAGRSAAPTPSARTSRCRAC